MYYNTLQGKNSEKKIQDNLIIVSFIRISFVRIIEIKQILFYCSAKRTFAVRCFNLCT